MKPAPSLLGLQGLGGLTVRSADLHPLPSGWGQECPAWDVKKPVRLVGLPGGDLGRRHGGLRMG